MRTHFNDALHKIHVERCTCVVSRVTGLGSRITDAFSLCLKRESSSQFRCGSCDCGRVTATHVLDVFVLCIDVLHLSHLVY